MRQWAQLPCRLPIDRHSFRGQRRTEFFDPRRCAGGNAPLLLVDEEAFEAGLVPRVVLGTPQVEGWLLIRG